jgi:histidine triad (HIT) family protein
MNNCIFCKIESGNTDTKFLYQDEHLIVFNDINPKAKTHILIVPRPHIPSLASLTEHHTKIMTHVIMQLPKIAAELNLTSFRTIINTGAASGQEVPHLHFHILSGGQLPGF